MNHLLPKSIRWRLPLSYAGVALLTALVLGGLMLALLRGYYTRQEHVYLESNADMAAAVAADLLSDDQPDDAQQAFLDFTAGIIQTRLTIADVDGSRIFTSALQTPESLVNQAAFGFGGAFDVAFGEIDEAALPFPSTTLSETIIISDALPAELLPTLPDGDAAVSFFLSNEIAENDARSDHSVSREVFDEAGKRLGTVTLSEGPAYGRAILSSVLRGWLIASAVAVLIAAAAGWWASRRVVQPLAALEAATTRMAEGDLTARADINRSDEFGTLARRFDHMAERIEHNVSTLRRFVADAAHELNTPLTALRTNLELISEADVSESERQLIVDSQTQVDRLTSMSQGLLDLSRIETAKPGSPHEIIDLNELISNSSEYFASQAEQAGIAFTLTLPHKSVMIPGNEQQLRQALVNLLDNAIKFTPSGGEVRLSLWEEGQAVLIQVQDTGIGIPPDDLPHLAERFHRGRNASDYPGNGLGLAIVKAIIEGHGGAVHAASDSTGTTITLLTPTGKSNSDQDSS